LKGVSLEKSTASKFVSPFELFFYEGFFYHFV
jgi:hypothetical protein